MDGAKAALSGQREAAQDMAPARRPPVGLQTAGSRTALADLTQHASYKPLIRTGCPEQTEVQVPRTVPGDRASRRVVGVSAKK